MRAQGFNPPDMSIPHTDFAGMARAMGADGATVDAETELDHALARAMEAQGPFVVDVRTDPHEAGPWSKRIKALILQGTDAKLVAR
jgi:acetolactate synthase-1/2/3 large subunit